MNPWWEILLTTPVELLVDAVVVVDDAAMEGWVAVAGDFILAVGARHEPPPRADRRTSLGGASVLPGFIDIHVHGGDGDSFGADEPANERVAAFHLRHGTTALLPTLVTAAPAAMLQGVEALGCVPESAAGRARILGVHLEGPFISRERRGAHDSAQIRSPGWDELERLCQAGDRRVRLVTTAPELPGFAELADAASRGGALLAAGHTNASGEQLLAAISGGVVSLTHTFNAMRTIDQRDPAVIEAITDTEVFCEVISDGIHVHPAMIRMLRSLAGPERVVLVTDASEFAGQPDGDYVTPRRSVAVADGAVRLTGTQTLAGSTLTLLAAARNYASYTGAGLPELAAVTSQNAARLLGEQDRLGRLQPGFAADLVVLDDRLECLGVMSSGTWVPGLDLPSSTVRSAATADFSGGAHACWGSSLLPSWSAASSNGLVVDIGGTKLMVAAIRDGVIHGERSFPISQFVKPAAMMDVIADCGIRLCRESGLPVHSAVVAVAGRIHRDSGRVLQSANLPFVDYPLAAELGSRLEGAQVRIEHDAACGLIGETVRGAGRGFRNVIYLTVSTGISVGILIDGAVLNGAHGVAGELGHTPVASPGVSCPCGSRGCLEAYASGRAFAQRGTEAAADGTSPALAAVLATQGEITAKDLLLAAGQGDDASAAIVDDAIGLLVSAIQMLLMTLDPDVFVLGGGVMSNAYFSERVIARSQLRGGDPHRVRMAQLGASSVTHGAIALLGGQSQSRRNTSYGRSASNEAQLEELSVEKGGG